MSPGKISEERGLHSESEIDTDNLRYLPIFYSSNYSNLAYNWTFFGYLKNWDKSYFQMKVTW